MSPLVVVFASTDFQTVKIDENEKNAYGKVK